MKILSRLNYLVSGLQPFSFHVVNIILHGIVSALILKVMGIVLTKILEDEAPKTAFLSALLFAVHPIHTESVSVYVVQHSLLIVLYIYVKCVCACIYLKFLQNNITSSDSQIPDLEYKSIIIYLNYMQSPLVSFNIILS